MRYLKAYQDTEPNGYLLRVLDMKTMWQALAVLVNYYLSIVTDVIRDLISGMPCNCKEHGALSPL